VDEEELKKPVDERVCFMDGHVSDDLEGTLSYLHKQFGFFIPDAEYCVDLAGLFKYCTKKVRAGHMCLYCQRGFHNTESAIQHMRAKFHCKLPWEHEEDLEEYDEFYDYSPLGDSLSDVDDDDEQTASDDVDQVLAKDGTKVELMSTGELKLTNGETGKSKILGHRRFLHIYKQRVHNKEESRPAFLANSKERLLLLYKDAGVETSSALTKTVQINGGRPAWMTKKLAQHQRRMVHYQKKLDLRDGMQINLQTKNHLHKGKNMGPGFGVHG
jgi:pre-60S factor REI1